MPIHPTMSASNMNAITKRKLKARRRASMAMERTYVSHVCEQLLSSENLIDGDTFHYLA
jgi:hypothetical protein